ncbi:RagB/SusD family nutrient uptake outer membrane protein, partial [Gemmatimonadota bacterium]
QGFETINMMNMMINAEFEPTSAVQTEYNQLIGEAHAIRGLAFFDMVKMFAQHYTFTADASHPGVPLVLEHDVTSLPSRSTVAQIYGQVISDFNAAIGLMTMDRAGSGMITEEAVQALLSRVYLYMEDFANARAMADAVINSGKYSLATGTAYVDQFVDGSSSEAIFEIVMHDTDNRGSDCLGCMYSPTGYGDYLPAKDLLNLIDPADIRWGMFQVDPLLTGIYAAHRVMKWPTRTQTDNVPVIRLSEVYLNRAEANARSGSDAAAQADLNLIRQRGLATAPDVTLTGQALLDEILIERRIELGYEGHRIHDIMRHKLSVTRVDVTGDVAQINYPCNFCILPVPFAEMDANENITQNAGYPG